MIWTPYFTIGHIGRTGGDAVQYIVCATLDVAGSDGKATEPNLKVTALYGDNKHRPFNGSEPMRVLGIRRLPSFIMSIRAHHILYARTDTWSADFCSQLKNGDDEIARMTEGFKYSIDRWLRCEYLRDDISKLLEDTYKSKYTGKMKAILYNVVTKAQLPYNRNVYDFFTLSQLETLYKLNPHWASYEKLLYGTILC